MSLHTPHHISILTVTPVAVTRKEKSETVEEHKCRILNYLKYKSLTPCVCGISLTQQQKRNGI